MPWRPRTSVIMPAYRAHETIRESVESALAQTVGDLEVIVVDDGSPEPIADALRGIDDPRLRLLRHDRNRKAPAARNTALRAARAPLVSQLDADDLWEPEYLESVLPHFEDPAIGLVYTNCQILGHPTGHDTYIFDPSVHPMDRFPKIAEQNPIPALTATMRRDAVRAVGGYAEWLWVCDDYHLYLKLARAGWRFEYIDRKLARYRWPAPERGQSYDRARAERDFLKMYAGFVLRHPLTPGPRRQVRTRLRAELRRRVSGYAADGAPGRNLDPATVEGFGEEWSRFDQQALPDADRSELFDQYFAVFPWQSLPDHAVGFDLGCGSGRWAKLVAPRVGALHCVDASPRALDVARSSLAEHENCIFHLASVDALPFDEASMDFGYSLGVLHHVPDTAAALASAVRPLRPGAPFLVYLYYAFDNRPRWFRALWRATDLIRRLVSRSPPAIKASLTTAIAAAVYLPLARTARLLDRAGMDVGRIPLSFYRDRSFYTMRTDAYDRFATRLEQRFTAEQVRTMMEAAGLRDIVISPSMPHWCAVGRRVG